MTDHPINPFRQELPTAPPPPPAAVAKIRELVDKIKSLEDERQRVAAMPDDNEIDGFKRAIAATILGIKASAGRLPPEVVLPQFDWLRDELRLAYEVVVAKLEPYDPTKGGRDPMLRQQWLWTVASRYYLYCGDCDEPIGGCECDSEEVWDDDTEEDITVEHICGEHCDPYIQLGKGENATTSDVTYIEHAGKYYRLGVIELREYEE